MRLITIPLPRPGLVAALALAGLAVLSGCSQLPKVDGDKVLGLVTPYRIEVVQGNVLTKEQVARVKPGMPREQVRDLLGSPLLTDVFHEDRWDYVFTIRRQGAPEQKRKVVALFDGQQLKSLETPDDLPTEREFVALINTFKPSRAVPKLELSEAERAALPVPTRPAAAATDAPTGVQRSYPPLEPRT